MGSMADTHEVINQVPPLIGYNPSTSPALSEALVREGGGWGVDEVSALGAIAGTARAQRWGELADRNEPGAGPTTITDIASTRSSTTPPTTSR